MIKDLLSFSFKNLKRRKLRAWLTTLGVIIGIASVVSLVLLGEGLQKAVEESLSKMGKDKLLIFPGKTAGGMIGGLFMGKPFTEEDVKKIEKLSDVEVAIPIVFLSAEVEYGKEKVPTMLYGIPVDKISKLGYVGYELYDGRYLKKGDKYDCILGYKLAKDAFSREIKVGYKVKINGEDFRVVGIWKPTGSRTDDYSITVPLKVLKDSFGVRNDIRLIVVKARDVDKAIYEIKKTLKRAGREDFTVMTTGQLIEQARKILGIISIIVTAIAGISLVVSAIGIMNTMYMAVTERTKEIGILKAIGARDRDVLLIFLLESGLLGMFGGIIGNILGIIGAIVVGNFAREMGYMMFKISIDLPLIVGTIFFAFVVGVLAGVFPARAAARLDPVDALREE